MVIICCTSCFSWLNRQLKKAAIISHDTSNKLHGGNQQMSTTFATNKSFMKKSLLGTSRDLPSDYNYLPRNPTIFHLEHPRNQPNQLNQMPNFSRPWRSMPGKWQRMIMSSHRWPVADGLLGICWKRPWAFRYRWRNHDYVVLIFIFPPTFFCRRCTPWLVIFQLGWSRKPPRWWGFVMRIAVLDIQDWKEYIISPSKTSY